MEFTLVEVEDSDYELIQNLIRFYIKEIAGFCLVRLFNKDLCQLNDNDTGIYLSRFSLKQKPKLLRLREEGIRKKGVHGVCNTPCTPFFRAILDPG